MISFKALLLAALTAVLTGVATANAIRLRQRLSRAAFLGFLAAIWGIYAVALGAALLVGPKATVGADRSVQPMLLWLAGLLTFVEVAVVRTVADWPALEPAGRRNRILSLAAMAVLFLALVGWTALF